MDKPALSPLPEKPYEFALWKRARVHIDYHVCFEKHYYSAPYSQIGKQVDVRATENAVEIFHQRQRVASHHCSETKGRYSTIKVVLNILKNNLDQCELKLATPKPLPPHANIRGETYYH